MRSAAAAIDGSAMPWPFSRSERRSPDEGAADPGDRRGEAGDPAKELRVQARRRLIGAAALLLAAVIVLPFVLDTAPRPVPDELSIVVAAPPPATRAPAQPPPVIEDKVAEPVAAPAPAPAQAAPPEAPQDAKPAPPERPPPAAKAAAATAPVKKIVVQVAALSNATAADELHVSLIKDGFTAYVVPVSTTGGTVHRVRIGPFASREEAQRAIDRLKAAGHKAAIVGG